MFPATGGRARRARIRGKQPRAATDGAEEKRGRCPRRAWEEGEKGLAQAVADAAGGACTPRHRPGHYRARLAGRVRGVPRP